MAYFLSGFILALSLVSIGCRAEGGACPYTKIEAQAGHWFDASVSILECSSMCEGAVCLFNVSEVDNYSLNMTGCSTISIRGEAYAGEREISFQYNFTCDLDPPVPKTQEALLLLRGLEMKIQLHSHEKSSVVETVELSCFSHLNDSRDVPVSFHLVRGTSTLSVPCPVDSNTTEDTNYTLGCVSPIQGGDWQICRNKSSPYNCYLILHDFDDSDSGNYTCSTNITGKEILSNELDLQALKLLGPAEKPRSKSHSPSSKVVLGLGIGIGVLLLLLLLMVLVLNAVRSYQRARNDRYQRLFEQDHEDINTPGTSSEASSVNVAVVNAAVQAESNGNRSTTTHPVVSLEQPDGSQERSSPPDTRSPSPNT